MLADRAGEHREVVRDHGDRPAFDLSDTGDAPVGWRAFPSGLRRVDRLRIQAGLDERALVEEQIEPLAHRELAERVLTFDEGLATHAFEDGTPGGKLGCGVFESSLLFRHGISLPGFRIPVGSRRCFTARRMSIPSSP